MLFFLAEGLALLQKLAKESFFIFHGCLMAEDQQSASALQQKSGHFCTALKIDV